MTMTIHKPAPSLVSFEVRPIEDRNASIEAGHYVARDVDFVLIVPPGSKDQVEQEATTWLAYIKQEARQGRYPAEWADAYERSYQAWKEGQEVPLEGTALVSWPCISPAQLKTLQGVNIRTVEQLATCNEEALRYVGMGGRSLKERAQQWLATVGSGVGQASEKLSALETENKDLKARVAKLEADLKVAADFIKSSTPPKKE